MKVTEEILDPDYVCDQLTALIRQFGSLEKAWVVLDREVEIEKQKAELEGRKPKKRYFVTCSRSMGTRGYTNKLDTAVEWAAGRLVERRRATV